MLVYICREQRKRLTKQLETMSRETAEYELEQLKFWFKLNEGQKGSEEWNENIQKGQLLMEIVLDL
jgi:hypothetical protein